MIKKTIAAFLGLGAQEPDVAFESNGKALHEIIYVERDTLTAEEDYAVAYSVYGVVGSLLGGQFRPSEIHPDALKIYYVIEYAGQVDNGGFSQYVYNTGWDDAQNQGVYDGLSDLGASRHLELFKQQTAQMDAFSPDQLEAYLKSEYFGENAQRDKLNELDDAFYELNDDKDLYAISSAWLLKHPSLVALDVRTLNRELEQHADAIPDMEQRRNAAREQAPDYVKFIRKLAVAAGHELDRITAGDQLFEHEGKQTMAWHFLTDQGHFYMIETDNKALMFNGSSHEKVTEITKN